MMAIDQDFPQRITKLRQRVGMTQTQVADYLERHGVKVCKGTLKGWEKGSRVHSSRILPKALPVLAKAFKVTPNYLQHGRQSLSKQKIIEAIKTLEAALSLLDAGETIELSPRRRGHQ